MNAPRPKAPFYVRLTMWATFLLLFAPLFTVVVYSFLAPLPEGGFHPTMQWYKDLFNNELLGDALLRSFIVATSVALCGGIIGSLGAFAIDRGKGVLFAWLRTLSVVPLVMPELVLGISSLMWFVTLRMTLGLHSIVLAHVTFAVSYVVVTVRGRLADFDRSLEEAAADLGASWGQILLRVVLPNVWPAVLAGMMMAFVLSFDDFLISFFNSGVGSDTLPVKLYSMIRFGLSREMYALSSLLVFLSLAGMLLYSRLRRAGSRI